MRLTCYRYLAGRTKITLMAYDKKHADQKLKEILRDFQAITGTSITETPRFVGIGRKW